MFSPQKKTLADCFKYRSSLGMDVFIETLKTFWAEKKGSVDKLMEYTDLPCQ
jgi:hypothetical protein